MYQQVCLPHLVEGRLKGIDQVGGQLADEPYRIGKQERQVVNHHLADGGVEGGKEFVLGKDITLRQEVHHRRLPHVGIPDECHTDQPSTVLTLGGLLLVNLHETLFQQGDTMQDDTAVHLQLCLTRSAKSHTTLSATRAGTATLSFQVGPQALQTGQHIAVLCQLHLCLRLGSLCPHGEDVENQGGAVEDLHFQLRLDIAYLLCRQLIVKDDHTHGLCLTSRVVVSSVFLLLDILLDLFELTLADIGHLTGSLHLLRKPLHGDSTCRISKKLQLVEILLGLRLVLLLGNQSHQHSRLCLDLGNHEFFHTLLYIRCKDTIFLLLNIYFSIFFVSLQPKQTQLNFLNL